MWSLETAVSLLFRVILLLVSLIAVVAIVSRRPWEKLPGITAVDLDKWQNQGWVLAPGGYLLILLGAYELWPAFWQWLKSPGSFFFWWLIAGIPIATTLVVTKQKFAGALTILWLAITLGAANWSTFPSYVKATGQHNKLPPTKLLAPEHDREVIGLRRTERVGYRLVEVGSQDWFFWPVPNFDYDLQIYTDRPLKVRPPAGQDVDLNPREPLNLPDNFPLGSGSWGLRARERGAVASVKIMWCPKIPS